MGLTFFEYDLSTIKLKGDMDMSNKASKAAVRREEKRLENEQKIKNAVDILNQLITPYTAPRAVKAELRQVVKSLCDPRENPGIRAANAVSSLESIGRSSKQSSSIRVGIWSAMSILESVRDA